MSISKLKQELADAHHRFDRLRVDQESDHAELERVRAVLNKLICAVQSRDVGAAVKHLIIKNADGTAPGLVQSVKPL